MMHISLTSFGRGSVDVAQVAAAKAAARPVDMPAVNKWTLLRALTTARKAFGLSDRDLQVLAALLSFHRDDMLRADAALIVFPSNRALSERSHGMAESTLRRHLAALVRTGLLLRHDSPNGKRYALRGHGGSVSLAFGFSLRPLLLRQDEILTRADEAEATQARCRAHRARIAVYLRDCARLLGMGQATGLTEDLAELNRCLRRKLDEAQLQALGSRARTLRDALADTIASNAETAKMSGNDSQCERHIQDTERNIPDSEETLTNTEDCQRRITEKTGLPSLDLVLRASPEIRTFASDSIEDWGDLITHSRIIAPMMGITGDVLNEAEASMGPCGSAVTLACMLQDFGRLRKPGGYLRHLARKSVQGAFDPGSMVKALLRREGKDADTGMAHA